MAINNAAIFNAAFVGAFAGMVHNVPPSTVSADYTAYTNEANAFAIELDSLVAPIPGGPTVAQADLYESLSYDFFAFIEAPAGSTTPTDYAHAAAVVLAEYTSAVTDTLVIRNSNTNPWCYQAAWTITGNLADDANSTTTIGSHQEYRRRIVDGPLQQNTAIAITGNLNPSDTLDTLYDTGGFNVTYTGTPVVTVPAQVIAAYVPRVVATNTPNQLTDTSAITWTPFIGLGFAVQMLDGPAQGLMATVVLDLTGNQCRIGSFLSASSVETQPVPTNHFQIVAYPQIPATARVNAGDAGFFYQNLYFRNQCNLASYVSTLLATGQAGATFFNCCFDGVRVNIANNLTMINCAIMNGNIGGSPTSFYRCAQSFIFAGGALFDVTNTGQNHNLAGHMLIRRGALIQGTALFAIGGQGLTSDDYLTLQDCGIFDVPAAFSAGISLREGAKCLAQTYWGNTGVSAKSPMTLDRSSKLFLLTTGQTATNATPTEIVMPLTANTTWAAARAAGGIWDGDSGGPGNRSDASIMVVL